MSIQNLIKRLQNKHPAISTGTALYVSAGNDTKALTFLHPDYVRNKGVNNFPDIGFYIFVDKKCTNPFAFNDGKTEIHIVSEHIEDIGIHPCTVFHLKFKSNVLSEKEFIIISINCHNKDFINTYEFLPDVFIGVCDGCAMGGNRGCENNLNPKSLHDKYIGNINFALPDWYVSDHFTQSRIVKTSGEFKVISVAPDFPFEFEKLAKLTNHTIWGYYGSWTEIGGATIFKVIRKSI